jgi:hypothetical protein
VYHSGDETLLFFENSVYSRTPGVATEFPPAKPAMFCLIDPDVEQTEQAIGFMTDRTLRGKTFPVLASSPNPSRYKIWKKQRGIVRLEFMPLWERDELKKG